MTQPKTTLYENLSIQPGASRSEIDVAYRQALKGLEVEALAHYSVDSGGAVELKRQLLEKTYAVLSRPDLKSRYDSGESVPFAAALPEAQRSSPKKRLADREALKTALRDKPRMKGLKARGDSQQLKAFRDNFQPDRLRPIAEVESELLAGKSNIVGTRPVDEPTSVLEPELRTETYEPSAEEPAGSRELQGTKEIATQRASSQAHAPIELPSKPIEAPATRSPTTTKEPAVARNRGLAPELLRKVSEHAESLDVFTGSNLANLRELAGLSREDMERITKVNQRHLRSIEADDYASLPVRVYVRGFIQEYARALGLDRDRVSSEFLRLYDGHRGSP